MDQPSVLAEPRNFQDFDKTEGLPFVGGSESGLKLIEGCALFRPHMPGGLNPQADVCFGDESVAFATQFIRN